MGSFNVSCGISNLSIEYGDRIGFVILDRAPDYAALKQGRRDPGSTLITYTNDLYRPLLPPIYGTYDDYGRLTDIVPSVTTQLIERMFHQPVKIVIDCISADRNVYNTHGAIAENYLLPGHLLGKWGTASGDVFKSLGFTTVEAYPDVYQFEGYRIQAAAKRQKIRAGGVSESKSWEIVGPEGKVLATGFQDQELDRVLSLFGQLTGLYPGFDREDWPVVQRLHDLSGMFFLENVFGAVNKAIKGEWGVKDDLKNFRGEWDEYMQKFDAIIPGNTVQAIRTQFPSAWGTRINEFLIRDTALQPEEQELLNVYKDDYSFLEVKRLLHAMTAANRILGPTLYAGQDGRVKAGLALAKISWQILKARKAEYED